ncbi:MAG: metallophosphoesterase [Oscillospiraceae bacterium]|jgi:predicted MPP superfamily phosphohydrolase|nr:metallophosphoesterase [Oscillospiraceae bacterium]
MRFDRIRHPIRWVLLLAMLLLVVYIITGYIRSLKLESTQIDLSLPARGAKGHVRIVQLSDLHRAVFGENNQALVDLVADKRPDLIAVTGDMIDARTTSIDATIDLFRRLTVIAPVAYSLGNHEVSHEDLMALIEALEGIGVTVLQNSAASYTLNGVTLKVGGVYHAEYLRELDDDGSIDILLCHFPEKLDVFATYGVPLTFCGHTHGGQFRVPLVDIALYAPGQGLFPQYTTGLYERGGSFMIVSRGLGNSSFPFRVHNPPEIIVAEIAYE